MQFKEKSFRGKHLFCKHLDWLGFGGNWLKRWPVRNNFGQLARRPTAIIGQPSIRWFAVLGLAFCHFLYYKWYCVCVIYVRVFCILTNRCIVSNSLAELMFCQCLFSSGLRIRPYPNVLFESGFKFQNAVGSISGSNNVGSGSGFQYLVGSW